MQHAITLKYVSLAAAVMFVLGMATTAFAYEELEIEIDVYSDGVIAEVSYDEDGEDVEEEYTYEETDLTVVYGLLADELGLTAEEVEAVSSSEEEDGSINDEESDDDDSDDEDEEEEDEESDDDDDSDDSEKRVKCESEYKNFGQKVRCEVRERNEERKEIRSEMKDRFKDFGKTTDRTELQSQLRELMQLLIQLLTQQMAMTQSDS